VCLARNPQLNGARDEGEKAEVIVHNVSCGKGVAAPRTRIEIVGAQLSTRGLGWFHTCIIIWVGRDSARSYKVMRGYTAVHTYYSMSVVAVSEILYGISENMKKWLHPFSRPYPAYVRRSVVTPGSTANSAPHVPGRWCSHRHSVRRHVHDENQPARVIAGLDNFNYRPPRNFSERVSLL